MLLLESLGWIVATTLLFVAATLAFGSRRLLLDGAIGVVLTGNLDDGTAGLWTIKSLGGTAVVQHPDDALLAAA